MTKRTVEQGFTTYVDASGATRFAVAGEEVDVHASDLARFDKVNDTAQVELGGLGVKPVPGS